MNFCPIAQQKERLVSNQRCTAGSGGHCNQTSVRHDVNHAVLGSSPSRASIKPRVLIACEFSGIVREEFRKADCDAWSCDLLPTEIPGQHFQGDVFNHLEGRVDHSFGFPRRLPWDLMIFHWPCTYLLNSGVRWFTTIPKKPKAGILYGRERRLAMEVDALCFKKLLECSIKRIAGENPTMCGQAQAIIGHKWMQHIQPYEFGHTEQKATFLWLKNLPPLKPTDNVYEAMMKLPKKEREKVHYASPGPERSKDRSRTYPGIARAMAEQWAPLLFEKHNLAKEFYKTTREDHRHVARMRKLGASNCEIAKALGIPQNSPVLME